MLHVQLQDFILNKLILDQLYIAGLISFPPTLQKKLLAPWRVSSVMQAKQIHLVYYPLSPLTMGSAQIPPLGRESRKTIRTSPRTADLFLGLVFGIYARNSLLTGQRACFSSGSGTEITRRRLDRGAAGYHLVRGRDRHRSREKKKQTTSGCERERERESGRGRNVISHVVPYRSPTLTTP